MISPNFDDEKLNDPTHSDLVDVLEDRFRNWILNPARELSKTDAGLVPAMTLALTYPEGIWCYKSRSRSDVRSKEFFTCAFASVFQSSDLESEILIRVGQLLYQEARCGLFHEGMSRGRILLSRDAPDPISVTFPKHDGVLDTTAEIVSLFINPREFAEELDLDLVRFVTSLREAPSAESESFCRDYWEVGSAPTQIGMKHPAKR